MYVAQAVILAPASMYDRAYALRNQRVEVTWRKSEHCRLVVDLRAATLGATEPTSEPAIGPSTAPASGCDQTHRKSSSTCHALSKVPPKACIHGYGLSTGKPSHAVSLPLAPVC